MEKIVTFKPIYKRSFPLVNPSGDSSQPYIIDVPNSRNHFERKRMRNDYFLRSYAENETAKSRFFLTLTYDPDSLPQMNDGRPCFCIEDVTGFLKKFKAYIREKFGITLANFRYLLVSEYGKTTHRPHYHALFFFGVPIHVAVIEEFIFKSWPFGFYSLEECDSYRVLTYVSKYVNKDIFALPEQDSCRDKSIQEQQEALRPLESENFYKSRVLCFRAPFMAKKGMFLNSEQIKALKKKVKIQPEFKEGLKTDRAFKVKRSRYTLYNFHRQSIGYGSSLIDILTEEDWKRGFYTPPGNPEYKCAIPKYIKQKVCSQTVFWKNPDGSISSKTNTTHFGKKVQVWRKEHNSYYVQDLIRKFSDPLFIESMSCKGIDIYPEDLSLVKAYQANYIHDYDNPVVDFHHYLLEKRHMVNLSKCPPDKYTFDIETGEIKFYDKKSEHFVDLRPWLYDHEYPGYESLLSLINLIQYELDRIKQRFEEIEEYRELKKKYLRSY